MKNQNQNSLNKRYRLYLNVEGWRFGILYDTTTDECCGINNTYIYYVKAFCAGSSRYRWFEPHNYIDYMYIEFDSCEDFKQSYPEYLI
jgi:hypothetical protein